MKRICKFWYNLTMTTASAETALFVGGSEALGLIGDKLDLEGRLGRAVKALD